MSLEGYKGGYPAVPSEGASVCIRDYGIQQDRVIDMDADEYGSPRMELHYHVRMWFKDSTMDPEWWVDDLGNVWFEFETRGEAMLFLLDCIG